MASSNAYLALYMFSLFLTAIPLCSVGSLIPFMSADTGVDETDYSIIFVMISITTLIAAVLYKVLGIYKFLPKHHTILIVSCLEMAIFCVVMVYMKTKNSQCIALSILKFFNYFFVISANICLMITPSKEEIGLWMSFSHGAFGFGALAGPIIVGFLGQNMFFVVAAFCLIITPFFYFMESPEDIVKTAQEEAEKEKSKPCSDKLGVLMCICIFVLIGIESTVEGWAPTFAVLTHVATKEHAVQFTSIFWTLESIGRFVFAYINVPEISKFTASTWGQLLVGILCALLTVMHLPVASAYLSAILYGVTLAMMSPLIMSAPYQFGLHYTDDQISNMMISTTVSAGVYSTITGVLMKITPDMYHYTMMAYSVIIVVFFLWIMATLREEGTSQETPEKGFEQIPVLEEIG